MNNDVEILSALPSHLEGKSKAYLPEPPPRPVFFFHPVYGWMPVIRMSGAR